MVKLILFAMAMVVETVRLSYCFWLSRSEADVVQGDGDNDNSFNDEKTRFFMMPLFC